MTAGTLYVVATPIGNRDDLSPRAAEVLRTVDLVAAEDTRHSGRLFKALGIETRLLALHDHNEAEAAERIVAALAAGRSVALVSDAGTPLLSDPGYRLLGRAHEAGIAVSPVPGPSALAAALSVAGLATDRFCFEGFLPAKAAARRARLAALADEPRSLVFYEGVHRVADLLADLVDAFGPDREAFVGRELTKRHEQCRRGSLGALAAAVAAGEIPLKGEFVLVVAGAPDAGRQAATLDVDALLERLRPLMPARQAVDIVVAVSGQPRNAVYARMLALGGGEDA